MVTKKKLIVSTGRNFLMFLRQQLLHVLVLSLHIDGARSDDELTNVVTYLTAFSV